MKRVSSGGFTLVESMIVLGVTGVLFVSMVGLVSGQQSKSRFKSAMTDITTQIQSQINEVSSGYYPNTGGFGCYMSSGTLVASTQASRIKAQGENNDCTFLGRAMMFGIPNTDPQEYVVQTLVGLRKTQTGSEPLNLTEANVSVLDQGASPVSNWPTMGDVKRLQFGTEVAWMKSEDGGVGGTDEAIVGLAIVSSPDGQLTFDQTSSIESGTVMPVIIPIPKTPSVVTPGASRAAGVDMIKAALRGGASASDGPIQLCFRSGTTNQSGKVTIGSNDSSTSIELVLYNTQDCT